jgi:hypothetical protein
MPSPLLTFVNSSINLPISETIGLYLEVCMCSASGSDGRNDRSWGPFLSSDLSRTCSLRSRPVERAESELDSSNQRSGRAWESVATGHVSLCKYFSVKTNLASCSGFWNCYPHGTKSLIIDGVNIRDLFAKVETWTTLFSLS